MSVDMNLPEDLTSSEIQKLLVNTLRHHYTTYDDQDFSLRDFIKVNGCIGGKYPDLKLESQIQIAKKLSGKYKDSIEGLIKYHKGLMKDLQTLGGIRYRFGLGDIVVCQVKGHSRFAVVSLLTKDSVTVTYRVSSGDDYDVEFDTEDAIKNLVFISKAFITPEEN